MPSPPLTIRWNNVGLQVEDTESFFTTFLRGTVGILSLDALELAPEWTSGGSDGGGNGGDNLAGSIPAAGSNKAPDGGENAEGESLPGGEEPLLGEAQWQHLQRILEGQVGRCCVGFRRKCWGNLPRRAAAH